ncbi:hypothetical protein, partial [Planktothrix sp.]|uniref:hypothetical protein n=1 Tax=Planktothrix sp. TaxID=3088171 RepID=UPI0038D3DB86
KQKLSSLEKAFQQVFGHPVKINFDTGGGTSAYRVQEVTPPSPSYSPVENSRVSSPEISPNSSINHQEQQQISSSPNQDIRESDQIDQVKMNSFKPMEMETGKMPVPLEKVEIVKENVELTPEEMDAQ